MRDPDPAQLDAFREAVHGVRWADGVEAEAPVLALDAAWRATWWLYLPATVRGELGWMPVDGVAPPLMVVYGVHPRRGAVSRPDRHRAFRLRVVEPDRGPLPGDLQRAVEGRVSAIRLCVGSMPWVPARDLTLRLHFDAEARVRDVEVVDSELTEARTRCMAALARRGDLHRQVGGAATLQVRTMGAAWP